MSLTPKRKRTRLGRTRYVPRCAVMRGKKPCWRPLPLNEHVGVCTQCRDKLLDALKAMSA